MKRTIHLINLLVALFITGCGGILPPSPNDPAYAPRPVVYQPVPEYHAGSLYNNQTAKYLFTDRKAYRVGDLLTVNLIEKTDARKQADTEFKKDTDVNIEPPLLLGKNLTIDGKNILNQQLKSGKNFKGEADSTQSNQLDGTITVHVTNIMPNGNLVIRGEKWLTLNQGDEFIRLSGLVRPEDIAADNTVDSNRIADARISYGGRGVLNESNEAGWLARFFNLKWWPF